ncbi:MAG: hypothetical protein NTU53_10530, partial [Planctomycetota bacterium]|nr:hypothetical protein [Planctomycetota bacterium]
AVTWLKLRWLSRPTCDILASFFTAVSFVKITTGHCNVRGDSLSWDYRAVAAVPTRVDYASVKQENTT